MPRSFNVLCVDTTGEKPYIRAQFSEDDKIILRKAGFTRPAYVRDHGAGAFEVQIDADTSLDIDLRFYKGDVNRWYLKPWDGAEPDVCNGLADWLLNRPEEIQRIHKARYGRLIK